MTMTISQVCSTIQAWLEETEQVVSSQTSFDTFQPAEVQEIVSRFEAVLQSSLSWEQVNLMVKAVSMLMYITDNLVNMRDQIGEILHGLLYSTRAAVQVQLLLLLPKSSFPPSSLTSPVLSTVADISSSQASLPCGQSCQRMSIAEVPIQVDSKQRPAQDLKDKKMVEGKTEYVRCSQAQSVRLTIKTQEGGKEEDVHNVIPETPASPAEAELDPSADFVDTSQQSIAVGAKSVLKEVKVQFENNVMRKVEVKKEKKAKGEGEKKDQKESEAEIKAEEEAKSKDERSAKLEVEKETKKRAEAVIETTEEVAKAKAVQIAKLEAKKESKRKSEDLKLKKAEEKVKAKAEKVVEFEKKAKLAKEEKKRKEIELLTVKKMKEEALFKAKTIAKHEADKKEAEALAVKGVEQELVQALKSPGLNHSISSVVAEMRSDNQELLVGNLPKNVEELELEQLFNKYGKVVEVEIVRYGLKIPKRGLPNYASVVFQASDSVDRVLDDKPILLYGDHMLNVKQKTSLFDTKKDAKNWLNLETKTTSTNSKTTENSNPCVVGMPVFPDVHPTFDNSNEMCAKTLKETQLLSYKCNLERAIAKELEHQTVHKQNVEDIINSKSSEMKNLILKMEKSEDNKNLKVKQINEVDAKLAFLEERLTELKIKKTELVKECDSDEKLVQKFDNKKHKLESFIEKELMTAKEEGTRIDANIQDLRRNLSETIQDLDNLPNEKFDLSPVEQEGPNRQLLDFIDKQIREKDKELECPVCLEIAVAPIFMCSEQHLICYKCRPRLKECPECRVLYDSRPKRHRYAEKAAEEQVKLRNKRIQVSESI